jgi:sirohydrochlorin ferrochelatase
VTLLSVPTTAPVAAPAAAPMAAPTDGRRWSAGVVVRDVVLAAHGSRDPRAAADTRRLVATVAGARPDLRVRAAYLDFSEPALGAALHGRFGTTTVVPLLFTPAYHARIDVPGVVAAARDRGVPVEMTDVLGPSDETDPGLALLVAALVRRLREASTRTRSATSTSRDPSTPDGGPQWDGIVLGAAGSRDARALATVETVARALGRRIGVRSVAGYATGVGPSVARAAETLRESGSRRIAYAAMFLAAGLLADRAATAARAAGIAVVAEPIAAAPELASLIGFRIDTPTR